MPSSSDVGFKLTKKTQISNNHCGPAVLQMLLSNLGISVTQKQLTKAAGVTRRLRTHGIRIDQMAMALKKLDLGAEIWFKERAVIDDVDNLLTHHGYPVGVEWQGLFYHNEQEEEEGYDYGHYSIITRVDKKRNELIMVDPYKDFSQQDRIMNISQFEKRWWDTNEIEGKITVKDHQLLFVVARSNEPALDKIGLTLVTL